MEEVSYIFFSSSVWFKSFPSEQFPDVQNVQYMSHEILIIIIFLRPTPAIETNDIIMPNATT